MIQIQTLSLSYLEVCRLCVKAGHDPNLEYRIQMQAKTNQELS